MPDHLYLSTWIRGFNAANMVLRFEKVLKLFPFSKLSAHGPTVWVRAIELAEPPLFEKEFAPGTPVDEMMEQARRFVGSDCLIEVDAAWDLWQQQNGEWKLTPTPVTLLCFGPEFDNESGDHIRIEFGLDSRFLPIEGVEGSARMGQSNLRSLLHLVTDLEKTLPVEQRKLWSESGINFAELLAEAVAKLPVN